MERIVTVCGIPHTVSVHQKSETLWIATGQYLGGHLEGKGSTAFSAMAQWVDTAKHQSGG